MVSNKRTETFILSQDHCQELQLSLTLTYRLQSYVQGLQRHLARIHSANSLTYNIIDREIRFLKQTSILGGGFSCKPCVRE